MPEILIDGTRYDLDTKNYRTVKEIIPTLKEKFLQSNQFLSEISADDKNLKSTAEINTYDLSLSEVSVLNIKTAKKLSAAQEAVTFLPSFLDKLNLDIKRTASLYEEDSVNLSPSSLSIIIEKLNLFIQLVTHIHQFCNVDSSDSAEAGLTIKELEIHLLSVVKAIHVANKRQDKYMLIDLLEHELIDNLTQWKISALPQIKRLNSI